MASLVTLLNKTLYFITLFFSNWYKNRSIFITINQFCEDWVTYYLNLMVHIQVKVNFNEDLSNQRKHLQSYFKRKWVFFYSATAKKYANISLKFLTPTLHVNIPLCIENPLYIPKSVLQDSTPRQGSNLREHSGIYFFYCITPYK